MEKTTLGKPYVAEIEGIFLIPTYQRRYRWGQHEIHRLLKDVLDNKDKPYCLQPIVIEELSDGRLELIDGQQRLTTIYLIYKYLKENLSSKRSGAKYSLEYDNRSKMKNILDEVSTNKDPDDYEDIDSWHICKAYHLIHEWFESFEDPTIPMMHINAAFAEKVKIIEYKIQTDSKEESIAIFRRLNSGKIPLTNAELIKALFLSDTRKEKITRERQEEMSLQWDEMEIALQEDNFWYFLTNTPKESYQTNIDLLFDLIADRKKSEKDIYHTFNYFDELINERQMAPEEVWKQIRHTFFLLKDWYEDRKLYHDIGYLIASNSHYNLEKIYKDSKNKTKKEFAATLKQKIKSTLVSNRNYAELSYEEDHKDLENLLLLYNVETVKRNEDETEKFPFGKFKKSSRGGKRWTLEHIHAQQSKMLSKDKQKIWLESHIASIEVLEHNYGDLLKLQGRDYTTLLNRMIAMRDKGEFSDAEFEEIKTDVFEALSPRGDGDYLHSISNLALIDSDSNSVLSNSTFDVKRNEIIKKDRRGEYIPLCTKRVFLKYYASSEELQVHFWSQRDRESYVEDINRTLEDYLEEKIDIEVGD